MHQYFTANTADLTDLVMSSFISLHQLDPWLPPLPRLMGSPLLWGLVTMSMLHFPTWDWFLEFQNSSWSQQHFPLQPHEGMWRDSSSLHYNVNSITHTITIMLLIWVRGSFITTWHPTFEWSHLYCDFDSHLVSVELVSVHLFRQRHLQEGPGTRPHCPICHHQYEWYFHHLSNFPSIYVDFQSSLQSLVNSSPIFHLCIYLFVFPSLSSTLPTIPESVCSSIHQSVFPIVQPYRTRSCHPIIHPSAYLIYPSFIFSSECPPIQFIFLSSVHLVVHPSIILSIRNHPTIFSIQSLQWTFFHLSSFFCLSQYLCDPPWNPLSLEEGGEEILTKREEEERRIAEMGRPMLGEHVKLEVIIEESYEFKVGSVCHNNYYYY